MMPDDIITRDIEGQLAVNTVSSTEANVPYNYDDCFTVDINGRRAVRVVGGAGAIDDNKIIIKSEEIPTASADELGKFYCYSGETNSSFAHGYIYECVQTGTTYTSTVEFEASTLSSSIIACSGSDFAAFVNQWGSGDITTITHGTLTYDQAGGLLVFVGKDSEETTVCTFQLYTEDYQDAGFTITGTLEDGDVFAFTCSIVESGSTYVWERIDVQPVAKLGRYLSGWNCATGLATTNPQESPYEYTTGDYFIVSAVAAAGGTNYRPNGSSYVIGQASTTVESSVVTINDTYLYDGTNWMLLKTGSAVTSINGQVGDVTITGNDILPSQTGYSGRVLGTDGFVAGWVEPEIVQRSTMPQASEEEVGKIYQYVGATDSTYTNGYFYKCVSDGATPTPAYSWEAVEVQASSGGLPDQTGNAGKFLTTDGTDASWSDKPLANIATGSNAIQIGKQTSQTYKPGDGVVVVSPQLNTNSTASYSIIIGYGVSSVYSSAVSVGAYTKSAPSSVAIGANAESGATNYGHNNVAIGHEAIVGTGGSFDTTHHAIQIGQGRNQESGTICIGLHDGSTNKNYKLLNSDGTIPAERLKNAATSPATMPTLAVADWSSNTQTVTVTGVTATNTVFVSPAPASAADYAAAGIICTAQGTDSLTFTCTTTPTNAITVNVVIIG